MSSRKLEFRSKSGFRLLLGRYEKKYTIARGIENALNREWESS